MATYVIEVTEFNSKCQMWPLRLFWGRHGLWGHQNGCFRQHTHTHMRVNEVVNFKSYAKLDFWVHYPLVLAKTLLFLPFICSVFGQLIETFSFGQILKRALQPRTVLAEELTKNFYQKTTKMLISWPLIFCLCHYIHNNYNLEILESRAV